MDSIEAIRSQTGLGFKNYGYMVGGISDKEVGYEHHADIEMGTSDEDDETMT
jgi:hypothetical protein